MDRNHNIRYLKPWIPLQKRKRLNWELKKPYRGRKEKMELASISDERVISGTLYFIFGKDKRLIEI